MSTNDYLNFITSEHRDKPKFIASLSIWLDYCQDIENLLKAINVCFDIDNAIGIQLDIIGQRIGVARTVILSDVNTILDDIDYRILLKVQVFKNSWKGTTTSIYGIWNTLFPENPLIIRDNQNMTMDVIAVGFTRGNQAKLVSNGYIVPKPQGVGVEYFNATLPIFGFGLDNETISGFGKGSWVGFN